MHLPTARMTLAAAAVALMTGRGTGSPAVADRDWALKIEPIASPAADSGSAPQLTGEGDRAIVSWLERAVPRTLLKFSERTATGWSMAKTVVSGNDLIVNAADVPSVRALGDGSLAAAWMIANSPDPEAYNLRIAFSKDAGATWSSPVSPHHDNTQTQHGFASLFQAPGPGAGLGLVWLDGRAANPKLANPVDQMSLRATTFSRTGQQRPEVAIDTRVCDCCPTSVALTSEGPIVAYRDRSAKEVRDIYVSRFAAGRWTPPVAVHNDGWRIEACPVNGPSIAARSKDVAVAWFVALNNQGKAYLAFSHDGGRTFGNPVRVDDQAAVGHVDVELLKDGSAAVSWIEFANDRQQFKVRRVEQDGTRSAGVAIAGTGDWRVAGHPRLAMARDELLFAWTESNSGKSRVQTARAVLR